MNMMQLKYVPVQSLAPQFKFATKRYTSGREKERKIERETLLAGGNC
jgi:hypothetical protein